MKKKKYLKTVSAYLTAYPHIAIAHIATAKDIQDELDFMIGALKSVAQSMPTRDADLAALINAANIVVTEVSVAWSRRKGTK
jgi:hypothetical protein